MRKVIINNKLFIESEVDLLNPQGKIEAVFRLVNAPPELREYYQEIVGNTPV